MSRILPDCPGSDPSDRAVIADVGFREEPDREEDDEEEKKDESDTEEGMTMTRKWRILGVSVPLICQRVKDEARKLHQRC
jgi:hypothetical protein